LSYRAPPTLTLGPGGSDVGRDTGPSLTVGVLSGVPGVGLRHPTLTRGVRLSYRALPTLTLGRGGSDVGRDTGPSLTVGALFGFRELVCGTPR
jgi:hypothetical protein